uniref:Uncharacterized protein n=1 Tax=Opuntia streptacantha TaxID=393608 RepID=A0A7C8Z4I2_OPUST
MTPQLQRTTRRRGRGMTRSTRFIGGSECGRGGNGYPRSENPRRSPGSGWVHSPHPRWRRVHTTSPPLQSRALPPSSTSLISLLFFPALSPPPHATSSSPPPRLPPWTSTA